MLVILSTMAGCNRSKLEQQAFEVPTVEPGGDSGSPDEASDTGDGADGSTDPDVQEPTFSEAAEDLCAAVG